MFHFLKLRFWKNIMEKSVSTEKGILIWKPETAKIVGFLEQVSQIISRIPQKT